MGQKCEIARLIEDGAVDDIGLISALGIMGHLKLSNEQRLNCAACGLAIKTGLRTSGKLAIDTDSRVVSKCQIDYL